MRTRRSAWVVVALGVFAGTSVHGDELPGLVRRLREGDVQGRWEAARALVAWRGDLAPAREGLVAAMRDDDVLVRRVALKALGRFGVTAVGWIAAALADPDIEMRIDAAAVLGALGSGSAGAVPALTHALSDPEADVRAAAARALGEIGSPARSAVPALVAALSSPDLVERSAVLEALGLLAEHSQEALPAVMRMLEDGPAATRALALDAIVDSAMASIGSARDALWRAEPAAKIAAAGALARCSAAAVCAALGYVDELSDAERVALNEVVRDLGIRMRYVADQSALHSRIPPRPAEAPPVTLATRTRDALRSSKSRALATLSIQGLNAALEVLPGDVWGPWVLDSPTALYADVFPVFLAAASCEGSRPNRHVGVSALAAWASLSEVPRGTLVLELGHRDPERVAHVVRRLNVLGQHDRWALDPLLAVAATHSSAEIRALAVRQLAEIVGPNERPKLERILTAETDPDVIREFRRAGMTKISASGQAPSSGIVELLAIASNRSRDTYDRTRALRALADGPSAWVLPTLRTALADTDPDIRAAAAWSLATIGTSYAEIYERLEDADGEIRRAIYAALLERLNGTSTWHVSTLLRIVARRDSPARVLAVYLLVHIGDASIVTGLEQAIAQDEPDALVKAEVEWACGVLRHRH